jgi:hypothetical protein
MIAGRWFFQYARTVGVYENEEQQHVAGRHIGIQDVVFGGSRNT